MKKQHCYYVYILTNFNETTFYTGVTNDIYRRMYEHKQHINPGFSDKYNLDKLVYCESYESIDEAITREKQLKSWKRQWKLDLIKSQNPMLEDISKKFDDMDW